MQGGGKGGKGGGGEGVECVICQEAFAGDQQPCHTLEECGHKFHTACLIAWFRRGNNGSCPLCRAGPQVPAEPVEAESEEARAVAAEAEAERFLTIIRQHEDARDHAVEVLEGVRVEMRSLETAGDVGLSRLRTSLVWSNNRIIDAERIINMEDSEESDDDDDDDAL
jgi:hypothetical protein